MPQAPGPGIVCFPSSLSPYDALLCFVPALMDIAATATRKTGVFLLSTLHDGFDEPRSLPKWQWIGVLLLPSLLCYKSRSFSSSIPADQHEQPTSQSPIIPAFKHYFPETFFFRTSSNGDFHQLHFYRSRDVECAIAGQPWSSYSQQ